MALLLFRVRSTRTSGLDLGGDGSVHGESSGAGLSHLLEHMVFKGTESFSSENLSQTVQPPRQWNATPLLTNCLLY